METEYKYPEYAALGIYQAMHNISISELSFLAEMANDDLWTKDDMKKRAKALMDSIRTADFNAKEILNK
tara:strand:- start:6224 stop:6430 length:207 start_codon:yes stop_codon:yes gene_type:complete